jgi:arylsulfatase A-like enzyme
MRRLFTGVVLLLITSIIFFSITCSNQTQPPNIVLITMDTLRADALGCYGNQTISTPVLDQIAGEGVLFRQAICQVPATLSSHTAIMTGRYPKTTGVRFRTHRVPQSEETLAEILQQNGYQTAAFIAASVLAPDFGLDQGFDLYDLGSLATNSGGLKVERRGDEVIDSSLTYLQQRDKSKPFFMWIHLYDPHTPYQAPQPFHTRYDPEYQGNITGSIREITRFNAARERSVSPRDLQHLKALYWGEVSYMDHQIGRFITALEQESLMDETILALIADHGENLGEKQHFFHGDTLYETEVHIPFMIRYPKRIPAPREVSQLVESIDLFPTLLQLSGAAAVPSYIDGVSLLPVITSSMTDPIKPGYMETEADVSVQGNKLFGIRSEEYKFIFNNLHRRTDVPLGLFTEIPLKGPSVIAMRIKGDDAVRLMVHVRYRTQELYASRDFQALSRLPSTVIHAETFGSDPIHLEMKAQKSFLPTPEGWQLQVTPELYRLARDYGESQGWLTDWMVIEGVGVDASVPYTQQSTVFAVDQFELYAPQLRFPSSSPKYRAPFWIVEDFEGDSPRALQDSGEGVSHQTHFSWLNENIFHGNRQQKVEIEYQEGFIPQRDELYHLSSDPHEENNLLQESPTADMTQTAEHFRILIQRWLQDQFSTPDAIPLTADQREALEALGYTTQ